MILLSFVSPVSPFTLSNSAVDNDVVGGRLIGPRANRRKYPRYSQ